MNITLCLNLILLFLVFYFLHFKPYPMPKSKTFQYRIKGGGAFSFELRPHSTISFYEIIVQKTPFDNLNIDLPETEITEDGYNKVKILFASKDTNTIQGAKYFAKLWAEHISQQLLSSKTE